MTLRIWTDQEFERAMQLHLAGWSAAEIGQAIGRTESAVRLKLIANGYSSRHVKPPVADAPPAPALPIAAGAIPEAPPEEDFRDAAEQMLEDRERQQDNRRLRQRAIEEAQRGRLLDIFRRTFCDCRMSFTIEPPSLPACPEHEVHAAVLLLGDTHIGKVCDPSETEGRADYNPAITVARFHYLEQEVIRLIESGPPIDELLVLCCGDMVEGLLNHQSEREETLLVSKQFTLAISLLSQFLVRLSSLAAKMRIRGVSGNHGRWPSQRRMPAVGRESNLDHLVYAAVESILATMGTGNIDFELSDSARQLISVKNLLLHLAHGDELKGGEYYVAGIKREVYNSVLRHGHEGRIPDLWVAGDKHVTLSLPVGNGSFMVNGSFVGEDVYGQRFAPAVPSQTLFWVCPRRGKVLQADIRLDQARPSPQLPYELSAPLRELVCSYLN